MLPGLIPAYVCDVIGVVAELMVDVAWVDMCDLIAFLWGQFIPLQMLLKVYLKACGAIHRRTTTPNFHQQGAHHACCDFNREFRRNTEGLQ
jgi:hypothetical protein